MTKPNFAGHLNLKVLKPFTLSIIAYLVVISCIGVQEKLSVDSSGAPFLSASASPIFSRDLVFANQPAGENDEQDQNPISGDEIEGSDVKSSIAKRSEIQDLSQVSNFIEPNNSGAGTNKIGGGGGVGGSQQKQTNGDDDEDDSDDDDDEDSDNDDDQRQVRTGANQKPATENKNQHGKAGGAQVIKHNLEPDTPRLFKLGLIIGR